MVWLCTLGSKTAWFDQLGTAWLGGDGDRASMDTVLSATVDYWKLQIKDVGQRLMAPLALCR